MRTISSGLREDDGYTLAELMVVVAVIGILLAVAIASYASATSSADAAACRQNQRTLEGARAIAAASSETSLTVSMDQLRPFVKNFDSVIKCPTDGTPLVYDPATGDFTCPNHPE